MKKRVAIVTGGTKGIGKGIADKLKDEGVKVVVSARKKVKTGHYFIQCDVSDSGGCKSLIKEVVKKFGRVDILVNNAGIYPFRDIRKMTKEEWDKVIAVNLNGMFSMTKEVIPYMIKQKYGKIVNISSIAGAFVGYPNLAHYCASKAGVVGFTRGAALDLAKYNINVNAVSPGVILTPGTKAGLPKKELYGFKKIIPKGRLGLPKDVAEVVWFLASDNSDYITGQTIVVDGGFIDQ